MSELAKPLYLMPIVIATTGDHLTVVDGGGNTAVSLAAGTYYWDIDQTVAGSFNAVLSAALVSAYGGAWEVSFDPSSWLLTIAYTGASTPTSITFADADVLSAYDLGDSTTVGDLSLTLTAKSWTATYTARWMWRPDEYLLDDEPDPRQTVVIAETISGAAVCDYHARRTYRMMRMEATPGARVYDQYAAQSDYATEAGTVASDPWVTLESFWRDAAELPANASPLAIRLIEDEDDWLDGASVAPPYVSLTWQDAEQLGSMRSFVELLTGQPLRFVVRLKMLES